MGNPYNIPDDLTAEFGSSSDSGSENISSGQDQNIGQTSTSQYDPSMTFTYQARGKDRTEDIGTILKRASRGYDYSELVNQHKQEVDAWQAKVSERERQIAERENRWKPYDEYAQQNPGWAEYIRDQWSSRSNWNGSQQANQSSGYDPQTTQGSNLPPEIRRELDEFRIFKQSVERERVLAKQAQEDQALHTEIQLVRQQYPDIDFDYTDPETGESLENQVLRHAQQNRIHNFSAAFRDLYFEKLMDRHVMKAKENVAKQMQTANKNGFIAQSDRSMLQQNQNQNNQQSRPRSWNELADRAIAELGLN